MNNLKNETIWRYMSFEKFISLLDSQSLYFSSVYKFDEKYEGALSNLAFLKLYFPRSNFQNTSEDEIEVLKKHNNNSDIGRAFEALRGLIKVNCWNISEYESNLLWKNYAENGKGVAIKSNIDLFKKSLGKFKLKDNYAEEKIYFRKINYIDFKKDDMPTDKYRFFYKHNFFKLENEFRALISLEEASLFAPADCPKDNEGIFVPVDLNILIDSIYVLDFETKQRIETCLKEKGFKFNILISEYLKICGY